MNKAAFKAKPATRMRSVERTIAAGEFKAKCLKIMDEVNETGQPVIVTKRGEPVIIVSPASTGEKKKNSIFGRLAGVMKIHGDPNDLIRPIVPMEDWDMLK